MKAAILVTMAMCAQLGVRSDTVVDVVTNSADHTNLATAVVNNELVATLSGAGPFTVFGPSNSVMPAGFAKSDDNAARLKYHVLPEKLTVALTLACQVVATVEVAKLKITKNAAGNLTLYDGTATATVSATVLAAGNGVVYSIDKFLTVPPLGPSSLTCTVVDVVVGSSDHTNLATAVVNNELVATLGAGPFTVFGPSNSVMLAGLPKSDANTALLKYHVLAGRFLAADLDACQVVATVNGKKLKITKDAAGSVTLNDGTATATVSAADLVAPTMGIGVVHSIDKVLTVPTDDSSLACPTTPSPTPSPPVSASGARRAGVVLSVASLVGMIA